MSPDTFSALVNFGAAGAVIAVVIIFLKSMEKRDAQQQAFFMTLHSSDEKANTQMTEALNSLVASVNMLRIKLEDHDQKVETRISQIKSTPRVPRK
jgi:hypothetical protein